MQTIMKQEIPTTPPRRLVAAASSSRSKTPTPTWVAAKPRNTPNPEAVCGFFSPTASSRARASPVRQYAQTRERGVRRAVPVLDKARDGEEPCWPRMDRLLIRRRGDGGDTDEEKEELRRKVAEFEGFVADLKAVVGCLKVELDVAQRLNEELLAVNGKLREELASAEVKVCRPRKSDQGYLVAECQNSQFNQNLIAWKPSQASKAPPAEQGEALNTQQKAPTGQCSQLPPLPPLPATLQLPESGRHRRSFSSLLKLEGNRHFASQMGQYMPVAPTAQDSIVGEIRDRSAHFLAIKADVETKGDVIDNLIQKVQGAAYTDIRDVLCFVDWLDKQLSVLADERTVLKHFDWPERKADVMREAAIEYRELESLEREVSSYIDDASVPCGVALENLVNLLDKSEQRVHRLNQLQSSATRCYQKYNIPMDWMLDSGLLGVLKQDSMKLANLYLKRVLKELQSPQNSEIESSHEDLMLQGLHFARRTYQLAGGLDLDTMHAFEEIRQRTLVHLGGSGEVSAVTPSL